MGAYPVPFGQAERATGSAYANRPDDETSSLSPGQCQPRSVRTPMRSSTRRWRLASTGPRTVQSSSCARGAPVHKVDLERGLEREVLDCTVCGKRVHYVGGLTVTRRRWALAEPAPRRTPKLRR
jgi:hypothetical protein